MAFNYPTVADFKAYFVRDFPYGTDPNTSVLDSDIAKAYGQTNFNFNEGLWPDQESFTMGYLWLAAHYLVVDMRASSQGINGQFSFLEASKSVGNVSQSFGLPERMLTNPAFAMLAKTNYGAKYLQLIYPQLAGQMFIAYGSTRP